MNELATFLFVNAATWALLAYLLGVPPRVLARRVAALHEARTGDASVEAAFRALAKRIAVGFWWMALLSLASCAFVLVAVAS